MLTRVVFGVLAAFWLTMNVLLWRAEYGAGPALGSSVPAEVVWEKILTAPDSSSLSVFHKGKKSGFGHWVTSVSEDLDRISSTDAAPEGMVRKIVNYRLELNGNIVWNDPADRFRFDSHLTLDRHRNWQEFALRLNFPGGSTELHGAAAEQAVRFTYQDETQKFARTFSFSELENPEALLQEFGGPFVGGLLTEIVPGLPKDRAALGNVGLHWEARNESLKLGHSSVRVFRLKATLLDRFGIVVFVSRVGEILRVELPDGIVLVNDQLGSN